MMKYNNREQGILAFHRRVANVSKRNDFPLLERLRFVGISSSNLDEFLITRLALMQETIRLKKSYNDINGDSEDIILSNISHDVTSLNSYIDECWNELYSNEFFDKDGIRVKREKIFTKCKTLITPIIVSGKKKFPFVKSGTMNIFIKLRGFDGVKYSTIRIPENLQRVYFDNAFDGCRFDLIEEIIRENLQKLFKPEDGYIVEDSLVFRVHRDANINFEYDDNDDAILLKISKEIRRRKFGKVSCLELSQDSELANKLCKLLKIDYPKMSVVTNRPLRVHDVCNIVYDRFKKTGDLSFKKHRGFVDAELGAGNNYFALLDTKNKLIINPYDSYEPVVNFIKQASTNPQVLAIKQTLYRVSKDSEICKALVNAAKAGKEVTVVVEVKARFDENNNMRWARVMERSGCHIVYTSKSLKCHSKMTLVSKYNSEKNIIQYAHIGTGNYNDKTAKMYVDINVLTSDIKMTTEISSIFNFLTGGISIPSETTSLVSPFSMKEKIIEQIDNMSMDEDHPQPLIMMKMNSLTDKDIIDSLYSASERGVQIMLNVRGASCLKPEINGHPSNIKLISMVGKYLEHARVYHFCPSGGDADTMYIGSADMMHRSLNRRVETLFDISNMLDVKEQLMNYFVIQMNDNTNSYIVTDGKYQPAHEMVDDTTVLNDSQKYYENLK